MISSVSYKVNKNFFLRAVGPISVTLCNARARGRCLARGQSDAQDIIDVSGINFRVNSGHDFGRRGYGGGVVQIFLSVAGMAGASGAAGRMVLCRLIVGARAAFGGSSLSSIDGVITFSLSGVRSVVATYCANQKLRPLPVFA